MAFYIFCNCGDFKLMVFFEFFKAINCYFFIMSQVDQNVCVDNNGLTHLSGPNVVFEDLSHTLSCHWFLPGLSTYR